MSELLSAAAALAHLKAGLDVIVKRGPDLPNVRNGDDIDVYSLDSARLLREIVSDSKNLPLQELRVREVGQNQLHIDFIFPKGQYFKLDVYSAFPDYSRFGLRDGVFNEMVAACHSLEIDGVNFPVLRKAEEAFVRYLEYLEFFWIGPEKTHHLDWILEQLTNEELGELFESCHRRLIPRIDGFKARREVHSTTRAKRLIGGLSYKYPRLSRISRKFVLRLPFLGSYLRRELGL